MTYWIKVLRDKLTFFGLPLWLVANLRACSNKAAPASPPKIIRSSLSQLEAMPNASYAGAEFHVYVSVLNFGTGFYAPVGSQKGRHGLLHLSIGLGF